MVTQSRKPQKAADRTSRRPLLQRILLAQESGIALVIVLMMILLTVYSGSKEDTQRVTVPQSAEVVTTQGQFTFTVDGDTKSYAISDGWELRAVGDKSLLLRKVAVNKFLNFNNLIQILVFASFIAIMSVGITAVISTGGIDLSVGSTYAIAALFGAIFLRYDWSSGVPSVSALGAGVGGWLGLVAMGVVAVVVAFVMGRKKNSSTSPTRAGKFGLSLIGIDNIVRLVLAVGVICLLIAGWRLMESVRDGWDMTNRSTLPIAATLPLAIGVCCFVGGVAGWINGVMIVGLRVHPFIITLGTMAAYRGLVALPTKAQTVGDFPASYQGFIKLDIGGVNPVPVLFMVLVALAGVFVLSRTVIGRQVYAIGGNEVAAKYAGIPVGRVKIIVYTMMGALAGLSASLYLGYFGAAETNAGNGYELRVIAAAVIGGASLSGGRGSALGAVLGALLVQMIDNAMVILAIDQNYNQIVMGGAIIAAVVLDQVKSRLMAGTR